MSTSSIIQSLETHLRSSIDSTPSHTIALSNLNVPVLQPFLDRTVGSDGVVQNAAVTVGQGMLTLAGTIPLLGTAFSVKMTASDTAGGVTYDFSCTQDQASALPLARVVEKFAPRIPAGKIPNVEVRGLSIEFGSDKTDLHVTGACEWPVHIASSTFDVNASVTFTSTSALISGNLSFGCADFSVTCDFQRGGSTIDGKWSNLQQPVTWDSLVKAAGLPHALDLPKDVPTTAFQTLELCLDTTTGKVELTGSTVEGAIGFVVLNRTGNEWGFAFGVDRPNACQPGDISPALKTIDFLQFSNAYMFYSSYTDPDFTLPPVTPGATPVNLPLSTGLNVAGRVAIAEGTTGYGTVLRKLFGSTAATVSAKIDNGVALTVSADNTLKIPNSPLVLDAPLLTVQIGTGVPDLKLAGSITFPLLGHTFTSTAALDISPAGFTGTLTTNAKPPVVIDAPFGLHGVALANISGTIGVTNEPPGIEVGGSVDFLFGRQTANSTVNQFAIGLQASPAEVDLLYLVGSLNQPITLETLAYTLLPEITIPPPFNQVSLNNSSVSFCDVTNAYLDEKPIPFGYAFAGGITAFGWSMNGALSLQLPKGGAKSAISGSMQMDPICLENGLVTITGKPTALLESHGIRGTGPAFSFQLPPAPGAPILAGTLAVSILGANASVIANVGTDGISFQMNIKVENDNAVLAVAVPDKHTLSAAAALNFKLDMDLELYGRPIHIDSQFTGHLSLSASLGGISLDITKGTFDGKQLPTIHLDGTSAELQAALSNVGSLICNKIKAEAEQLFEEAARTVETNISHGVNTVSTGGNTVVHEAENTAEAAAHKLLHM